MSKNYMKLEIKSMLENVFVARVCVNSFLSNIDIGYDELMDIKTALSEAVTNCVEHAYDNIVEDKYINIECEILNNDVVKIIVEDNGNGIEDVSLAMTPTYTSKPESEHAGIGFTIMESFMDEVIVDSKVNKGTKVLLTKVLKKRNRNTNMQN